MGLFAFNRMRRMRAQQAQKAQKVAQQDVAEVSKDVVDVSKMKVEEIKAKLTALDVEFDKSAKKEELLELLKSTMGKNE
ncbi:MAG: HeH/LEM domain-containing protein [[Pasteurella] mairii]|uniref:HeH/LEM domain n=1 Tax=[Pasteurella] mairii TaxID=757 RepID=A0A379B3X9_9PAST|nr:HeH/LEM domain-containing protein [[Pasteurella] mairii]SUB33307.1 HeH/LEM domain [[Pasteurella] mairii]